MTEQNDRRFGFRTRALHAGGIPCLLYTSDAADE